MNLAIDVGNTSVKAALFEGNNLKRYINRLEASDLEKLITEEHIVNIIISSVNPISESLLRLVPASIRIVNLDYQLPLPISHLYQTPKTLGMDRVAAVVGATVLFPSTNRLVLDAGTCITYDFIDDKNMYHGGSISLGLQMRFRALHEFTAKLPLFSKDRYSQTMSFIGNSTETSMLSGVINGMKSEIEGFIRLYVQTFGTLQVIFCGGDADFLVHLFEKTEISSINISQQRYVLLIGLNHILQYNLKK